MSQKQRIQSRNFERVLRQVRDTTPEAIVKLIAAQLDRCDEAAKRIEKEGSVVRDTKGSVIAHPAIAIELAATKSAADLLLKHGDPRKTIKDYERTKADTN